MGFKTKAYHLESARKNENESQGRIPVRYVLTFLLATGTCICITARVNVNIAIVAMVRPSNSSVSVPSGNEDDGDTCPIVDRPSASKDDTSKAGVFDWSPSMQGVVVGGFYYGYICTQVIGGRLAERIGPRFVFIGGIVGGSLMNLVFPLAAEYSFALMVASRILTGAFQGFTIVSMYYFVANWYPTSERGLHLALALTGLQVGNVITMPAVGYLCQYGFAGGWPSAFYLSGAIGLGYCIPFFLLTSNTPEEHPRISKEELAFIQAGAGKTRKTPPVPWPELLKSVPVWTLCFLRFSSSLAFHLVQSKIPAYLDTVLQFPIENNGLINSGFYFCKAVVGIISGKASDILIRREKLTVNCTRKVFQSFTMLGASACLVAVPLVGCQSVAVIVLLTLSMTVHGLQNGGEMPVAADLAPAFSGTLFGLSNSFASAGGILAPSIAGVFLDGKARSLTAWSYVFYLTAGICAFGCVIFLLLGSANRLTWGKVESHSTDDLITVTTTSTGSNPEKKRY